MTVRERPILFNSAMVRAIRSGAKTQTRRAVKPQPPTPEDVRALAGIDYCWLPPSWPGAEHHRVGGPLWAVRKLMGQEPVLVCPFGQPGDLLWIRETWAPRTLGRWSVLDKHMQPLYRASEDRPEWKGIWRSSIHIPRWACRLVLEITDVRVKRLQAISEADAIAEGADENALPDIRLPRTHLRAGLPMAYADCREVFADLWDSTGGHWDSNPWVWVIHFKRLEVNRV